MLLLASLLIMLCALHSASYGMDDATGIITYAIPQASQTYQAEGIEAHFTPVPSEPPHKYFCAHTREQGHEHTASNTSEHDAYVLPDSMEVFYVLKARKMLEDTPALALITCEYKDRFVHAYTSGTIMAIRNDAPHIHPSYFSVWDMQSCKKIKSDSLEEHIRAPYIDDSHVLTLSEMMHNDELKKMAFPTWLQFHLKHYLGSYDPTWVWVDEAHMAAYAIYYILRKRSHMRPLARKDIVHLMIAGRTD